jgi:hypothetical protein
LVADLLSPVGWFGRVSPRLATHFLLLRQKKVSKEKASRSPGRCAVPCAARVERGRAELAFGSDNARPDPLAPALLSPATRQGFGDGVGFRFGCGSGLPFFLPLPLGEGRGEGKTNKAAGENAPEPASAPAPRRHALASSAGPGGSGRALSERSEFSPTPPGPSNAACPQRSGGTAHPARLFFAYFLLGVAKESESPAGARPGTSLKPMHMRNKR